MSPSTKKIIDEALALSEQDRALVAEQLLLSLAGSDFALDQLWAKEAEARIDAYKKGDLKTVSLQEVFAKYKTE
jgi:putative addiction module component (TIGR02574 family)